MSTYISESLLDGPISLHENEDNEDNEDRFDEDITDDNTGEETGSSEDDDLTIKGLLITTDGTVTEFSFTEEEIIGLPNYQEVFGYYDVNFYFLRQHRERVNPTVSLLLGKKCRGSVILFDYNQRMNLTDFEELLKYRKF